MPYEKKVNSCFGAHLSAAVPNFAFNQMPHFKRTRQNYAPKQARTNQVPAFGMMANRIGDIETFTGQRF
ncbi:MAG: hypothetical protein KGP35_04585 [Bacteroidetes bacterium]|nr:hypothetical protein [Bacteroidota bacterium]